MEGGHPCYQHLRVFPLGLVGFSAPAAGGEWVEDAGKVPGFREKPPVSRVALVWMRDLVSGTFCGPGSHGVGALLLAPPLQVQAPPPHF